MAEAQQDAAAVAVKAAESDVDRLVARRELAEKQYRAGQRPGCGKSGHHAARRRTTARPRGGDRRRADPATWRSRRAKAKLLAAQAAVEQAKADAAEARASLGVAEAHLDKAKVNLEYARIVAPFDGVVTHRTFHPGALIRSATEGGRQPLLTVKRTDLMRVVVLVPDRDVVLTTSGDPAVVTVDALGGRSFQGTLARIARAEDAERLMRVEIDLPNPENLLCDGMYGKATITLERDAKSLAVPPACVVEHMRPVPAASSSSSATASPGAPRSSSAATMDQVEILSGISPDDAVVRPRRHAPRGRHARGRRASVQRDTPSRVLRRTRS